jgi:hypothetical protein
MLEGISGRLEHREVAVAPYTVSFLGPEQEVQAENVQWFEHEDHALDTIGRSRHPHEIVVHQGQQLVARFPPWPPRSR